MIEKFAVFLLAIALLIILITLALFPMIVEERRLNLATAAPYIPSTATPAPPISTWTPDEIATADVETQHALATWQAISD